MATKHGHWLFILQALALAGLPLAAERPLPPASPGAALQTQRADQLLERANFVFVGVVEQRSASNLSAIPASPSTSLVRVERVIHGNDLLQSLVGQVLTVYSNRAVEHRVGQASTFFLDVDTFGENVSGFELGRFTQQAGDAERHPKVVAEARALRDDREIGRRISLAQKVVQGQVLSVEPAGIDEPVSEHAAHWQKAVIAVASAFKGGADGDTVTFYFPSSPDKVWRDAPRFAVGQQGVWILRDRPQDYSRKSAMIPGLTALDPKDYQRPEQSARVQRLVANR